MTTLAVAVTVTVAVSLLTAVKCPHGGFLFFRPGAWVANVQPVPDPTHVSRGDAHRCKCVVCRNRWYEVILYRRAVG